MADPFVLHCHRCSQKLEGAVSVPMEYVGGFKIAAFGRIPRGHAAEVRKRCTSCCWLNIFQPFAKLTVDDARKAS